ncbi:MAG: ParA family protein [Sulfuricurvum sp.]|uniref:ParA family protein n=1 Tax=Sulfuricurvum sp. TaxID=2025608 RepID=UPI00261C4EBA|nr:ParA family protein [Sulfuricurvum sp.]MDD2368192.1 ParA family protein [Sulfuricurvum sp.]MDD2949604.1 ParA family protein [Sulfuricurvum sp.]MDD5118877.1 ParA family protein [Sulfuricurvum sp.]
MILTLSHQKGGVGKSTVAWNLAVSFSKIIDVRIIDLDTQRSLTVTNALRQEQGLNPITMLHFNTAEELAEYAQNDSDDILTIIDSGGFDSAYNRVAIIASDLLITPVSDKPFDLMGLQKYEEILKSLSEIQGEIVKTHVLFNNINPAMKRFGDLIEFICMSEHFELLTSILRQRVDIAHSVGEGKSIKEYRIFSRADQEMDELFDEVKSILNIK